MILNIPLSMLDSLHLMAVRAGKEIMDVYNSDFDVEYKGDSSPVTAADQIGRASCRERV